jgi:hypothetical protein
MHPRISKTLPILLGFIWLSNAIDAIREVVQNFSKDVYYKVFINEWLALYAIIPFGVGWLASYLTEIFIKHTRLRYAKAVAWIFFACVFAIMFFRTFFEHNGFFREVEGASLSLLFCGFCLRISTFGEEQSQLFNSLFSLKKI